MQTETKWFIARNGQTLGPFSLERVTHETVSPDTLVWHKGMAEWAPAGSTELAAIFFGTPPQLPPPIPGAAQIAEPRQSAEPEFHNWPPSALTTEPNIAVKAPRPAIVTGAAQAASKAVQLASQPGVSRNYIAAHWAGEHSLGRSYWINVLGVSFAFAIAVWCISGTAHLDAIGLNTIAISKLTMLGLSLLIVVWQLVGLVRAILRRQPDPAMRASVIWGWIGAAVLAIGTCVSIPKTLLPMAGGFIQILQGDTHMAPLQVRVLAGGKAVEIAGGLQSGSAEKVLAVLQAAPSAKVLHIESSGGRVREALEIARYVKQRGMTTYVSQSCMSAATLIFAAGSKRYIEPKAKLGFHAGAFPGISATELTTQYEKQKAFMLAAGIAPTFIEKVYSTPNETMWKPTVSELESAKVITAVARPGQFTMSSAMVDAMSPEQLDKSLMEVPAYRALRKYDAKGYQKILEVCVAAAEQGESLAAAYGAGREILMPIYLAAMPRASDDTLNKMAVFWQVLAMSYGKSHPTILRAIFDSKPLTGQPNDLLPNYPTKTEFELMSAVFNTAADKAPTADEDKANADMLVVFEAMEKLSAGATEKFSKAAELNDRENIAILGLYFRCINEELPPDRRANVIRFMLSPN